MTGQDQRNYDRRGDDHAHRRGSAEGCQQTMPGNPPRPPRQAGNALGADGVGSRAERVTEAGF
jgi:hypothetical protein